MTAPPASGTGAALVVDLLILAGLMAVSAFCSMSETALFSLGAPERRRLESQHGHLAAMLRRCLQRPHRLLVTILLSNLLANVLYFAFANTVARRLWPESATGQTLSWFVALLVLILGGEITPKVIAWSRAPALARVAAPVMLVLEVLWAPVRWLADLPMHWFVRPGAARHGGRASLTADEISEFLEHRPDHFQLDQRGAAMVREVIQLGDLKVREVMTPRVDVVAIDVRRPLAAIQTQFREQRLPWAVAHDGSLDRVLGVLEARDLFLRRSPSGLAAALTPLPVVPEMARVDQLVRLLREGGTTRALVVDEHGGTAGVVTLETVVAGLLGDLFVGEGREPVVKALAAGVYQVDGGLPIREWEELFGFDVEADRFETVGGYVLSLLGRMPKEGDSVGDGRHRYVVLRVRGRRIRSLEVREAQP
jgi:putative hemolysin